MIWVFLLFDFEMKLWITGELIEIFDAFNGKSIVKKRPRNYSQTEWNKSTTPQPWQFKEPTEKLEDKKCVIRVKRAEILRTFFPTSFPFRQCLFHIATNRVWALTYPAAIFRQFIEKPTRAKLCWVASLIVIPSWFVIELLFWKKIEKPLLHLQVLHFLHQKKPVKLIYHSV